MYLHEIHPDAILVKSLPKDYGGVTGYGKKIKTKYKVKIGNRLHRLYCCGYPGGAPSNSGTFYWVSLKGEKVMVDKKKHEIILN